MRWFGTTLLDRYGRVAVLRLCAGLSLVGLLIFGLAGPLWLAVVGIVAWGAGAALGFPVGMSAAADDPLRAAARVSVVSTIGYSAFLAGPPAIRWLRYAAERLFMMRNSFEAVPRELEESAQVDGCNSVPPCSASCCRR